MARSQSHERLSPKNSLRTLSLPSQSPSSSSELSLEVIPAEMEPAAADSAPKLSRRQAKAANQDNQDLTNEQCRKAMALCTVGLELVEDYQLRKILKPLLDMEKVNKKRICNPVNIRSAPMVTTFVRLVSKRTKGVWKFLDTICQAAVGVRLAELEHSSLRRSLPFCSGRVPILIHPSFYRSLKVWFLLDVGGVSRDGQVNTELGTGSLRQAVGILNPEDFRPIVDTEYVRVPE